MSNHKQPLFALGKIVATPGALDALLQAGQTPEQFLLLHQLGDWGIVDEVDKKENDFSVQEGLRILSAYRLATEVKIWVITESDRSVTTILLPSEY